MSNLTAEQKQVLKDAAHLAEETLRKSDKHTEMIDSAIRLGLRNAMEVNHKAPLGSSADADEYLKLLDYLYVHFEGGFNDI